MNALASYLRHLIVTGILLLVEKYRLPVQGAEDAANLIALTVIGTVVWAVAKYCPELAKRLGLLAACLMLFPGCADTPLRIGYYQDGAGLSYSRLDGLSVEVERRSSK